MGDALVYLCHSLTSDQMFVTAEDLLTRTCLHHYSSTILSVLMFFFSHVCNFAENISITVISNGLHTAILDTEPPTSWVSHCQLRMPLRYYGVLLNNCLCSFHSISALHPIPQSLIASAWETVNHWALWWGGVHCRGTLTCSVRKEKVSTQHHQGEWWVVTNHKRKLLFHCRYLQMFRPL